MAADLTVSAYPGAFYPGQAYPGQIGQPVVAPYPSLFVDARWNRATVDHPDRKSGGSV